MSIGGGWAKFLQDQNLGEGALLTFEVVDERRLVVAIHNRSPYDLHEPQQLHGDTNEILDLLEREAPEAGDSQPTRSPLLSKAHGVERASFRKKLRKTHTLKYDSSRLVSATPPPPFTALRSLLSSFAHTALSSLRGGFTSFRVLDK